MNWTSFDAYFATADAMKEVRKRVLDRVINA